MNETEWITPNRAIEILEEKRPACYVQRPEGNCLRITVNQALNGCRARVTHKNPGKPFAYRDRSNIFFAWPD